MTGELHAGNDREYYWIASYTGDVNNNAVAGTCGDLNETSTVSPSLRRSRPRARFS